MMSAKQIVFSKQRPTVLMIWIYYIVLPNKKGDILIYDLYHRISASKNKLFYTIYLTGDTLGWMKHLYIDEVKQWDWLND